jgi:ABC-type branched-subunit amino acid transport system substrate-binding protein
MLTGGPVLRALRIAAGLAAVAAGTWLGGAVAAPATPKRGALRVAVLVPTGAFGIQSRLVANGAEIAAAQLNAKGGISRTFVVEIARTPLRASASPAAVIRRLAASGTHAVILPCNNDHQTDLAKAASKLGVMALAPCNTLGSAEIPPLVWAVGPTPGEQAAQTLFYIRTHYGTMPAGYILNPSRRSAYASTMAAALRAAAAKNGMKIVGQGAVRLDGRDAARAAAAIQRSGAGTVLTTLGAPQARDVITKLRKAGYTKPIHATDAMDATLARRGFGSALNDVRFVTYGFARPSADRFLRDYRARFKARPQGSFPGLGFETVRTLEAAVARSRSTVPRKMDEALGRGLSITGIALGDVTYPGGGVRRPVRTVGIAGIVNGQYVPLLASRPAPSTVPQ